MAAWAKPLDEARIGVIGVMAFGIGVATDGARFFWEMAAIEKHAAISTAI